MTNITFSVWDLINNDPSIKRGLARGILNHRALAKYILNQKGIEASLDAVITAIRRYNGDNTFKDRFNEARKIVKKSRITTRSDIVNIAIEKDNEVQSILPKLFSVINFNKGEVLRIIQADESIKVIIDQKNMDRVLAIIPKKHIIKKERKLAEITLKLDKEAVKTPGIMSVIFQELLNNDINVVETFSCVPEMILLVKEKDLLKAYGLLFKLCSYDE